ncbi:MAG: hypothetical protein ACKO96_09415 [Flammeovirgaceae bacterium]
MQNHTEPFFKAIPNQPNVSRFNKKAKAAGSINNRQLAAGLKADFLWVPCHSLFDGVFKKKGITNLIFLMAHSRDVTPCLVLK